MITDEESRTLIAQARVDKVWMNQAVRAYRPFIIKWASGFARRRRLRDFDDLIATGLVVSVRAMRAFDLGGKVPWLKFLRLCVDRKWRDQHPVTGRRRLEPVPFSQLYESVTDRGVWRGEVGNLKDRMARDYTVAQVREILEKMDPSLANLLRAAYGIGEERRGITKIALDCGVSRKTQRGRVAKALKAFKERWEPLAARA